MQAIILLLAAALCCGSVHAAVPHQINYQGYLTSPGGAPVDATVQMVLKLYDVAAAGTALHSETQSVVVNNGVFNVLLGAQPANLLVLPFDVPYWLGVKVGADAEMAPRQPVAAAAYAIRAASAEALASTATVQGAQITGTVGNSTNFTGALAGDVTGTQSATTISPATVTAKALTGFASGGGTITASDSILTAINKLDGNLALKAPLGDFADFYALMPFDNPATVAVGSAVQFPQDGPLSGGIFRVSASQFLLPAAGTYQVMFQVSVDEPGQLVLGLDSGAGVVELAHTVVGRATGTSQIVGVSLLTTSVPNSLLSVRNPAGNFTALTVMPLAGGTHSTSAHLVITRLR